MRPSKSTAMIPLLPNDAYTRVPSVLGVADAALFFWCSVSGVVSGFSVSHSSLPSARLKASIDTRPSPRAVVRKMRSFQTIGDECPRPGTVARQSTFSVLDQRSGYPESVASPCPLGPRHRGQYDAASLETPTMETVAVGGVCAAARTTRTQR